MARSYVRQNVVNRFELQPRSRERSYDSLQVCKISTMPGAKISTMPGAQSNCLVQMVLSN